MRIQETRTNPIPRVDIGDLPDYWQHIVPDTEVISSKDVVGLGIAAAVSVLRPLEETGRLPEESPFINDAAGNLVLRPDVTAALSKVKASESRMAKMGLSVLLAMRGVRAVSQHPQAGYVAIPLAAGGETVVRLRTGTYAPPEANDLLQVSPNEGYGPGDFRMRWLPTWARGVEELEVGMTMYLGGIGINYGIRAISRPTADHLALSVTQIRNGLLTPLTRGMPERFMGLGQALFVTAAHLSATPR